MKSWQKTKAIKDRIKEIEKEIDFLYHSDYYNPTVIELLNDEIRELENSL